MCGVRKYINLNFGISHPSIYFFFALICLILMSKVTFVPIKYEKKTFITFLTLDPSPSRSFLKLLNLILWYILYYVSSCSYKIYKHIHMIRKHRNILYFSPLFRILLKYLFFP